EASAALAAANKITKNNLVSGGQVLVIPVKQEPPPVTTVKYTVKAGDTLYSIDRKYNTTVTAIAKANNITNVNSLRVG
ncbi:LysM domain-containing protein, partial [Planococcus sp. SIMBA_143]